MKAMKKVVCMIMVIALAIILYTSVSAYNLSLKTSVKLGVTQSSVISSSHAGRVAQARIYNSHESAGNAYLILQSSHGSSWGTLTTIYAGPGITEWTNVWGGPSDALFRVQVHSTYKPITGYPGRIATGYLYTGY